VGTTRLGLLTQVATQLSQYRQARVLVEEYEKTILPQTTRAAELVRQGYAAGINDLATFLQAQQTLIQSNSDYVDALQNLWTNAAQVAGLLQMSRFPTAPPPAPVIRPVAPMPSPAQP
jgi:outer membrane protein TolC